MARDLLNNAFQDRSALIHVVEPGSHMGRGAWASRNNDNVRCTAVGKVSRDDARRMGKHFGVPQIVDVTFDSCLISIHQSNFSGCARDEQRISAVEPTKPVPTIANRATR
jgi:hypothetical protein